MADETIRTKGDAIAAGKTHLHLRCGCKSSYRAWEMLPNYPDHTPLHLFARKMRCKDRCKEQPQVVGAASLDELTPKNPGVFGP